jgi:hypothetical protein
MKPTVLFSCFWTFFLIPSFGADTEMPPENIIKHFEWCATPKDTGALITRYESFWKRYLPKEAEYEDAIHHTFVRLTAYRLAALYADANNPKKCREMLQWLEAHDQAIPK